MECLYMVKDQNEPLQVHIRQCTYISSYVSVNFISSETKTDIAGYKLFYDPLGYNVKLIQSILLVAHTTGTNAAFNFTIKARFICDEDCLFSFGAYLQCIYLTAALSP